MMKINSLDIIGEGNFVKILLVSVAAAPSGMRRKRTISHVKPDRPEGDVDAWACIFGKWDGMCKVGLKETFHRHHIPRRKILGHFDTCDIIANSNFSTFPN